MTALARAGDGHQAMPVRDSWYEERTQHPANMKATASYPVVAVCRRCHGRIRLAAPAQAEWSHVTAGPGVRGTAESA